MDIKQKTGFFAAIFTYALLFCNGSCSKAGLNCANSVYSFELPVKAFPDKDSILVGDSIFLEINESTSFKETSTGQIVDYSGAANLGSAISFLRYDSASQNWAAATSMFSFQLSEGIQTPGTNTELYRDYLFAEKNGRYLFKLTVLPERPGLFRLVFSNSGNTYRSSDRCTKAGFVINFKDTNHNRQLAGYTGEDIPGGDFFFHVGK